MSLAIERRIPERLRRTADAHPIARETTLATLVLAGFALLWDLVSGPPDAVVGLVPDLGDPATSLLVTGLVGGSLFLVPVTLLAVGYVRVRDVPVALEWPGPADLPLVAVAAVGPPSLALAVDAVADATGTSTSAVSGTFATAQGQVPLFLVLTALALLVTLPVYLLAAHVVVQSSLRRVASGPVSVALTTAIVGAPTLWGPSGLFSRNVVLAAALFVPAVALAVLARDRFDRASPRYLGHAPLAAFVVLVPVDFLWFAGGLAEVTYPLAQVAVVGFGAYAYERTDSLALPALALAGFEVATGAIVFFLEAGVRP